MAQLGWAILEEKRRFVRTLISQVIVSRDKDGRRKIKPVLALDMPVKKKSLAYGDPSPDFRPSTYEIILTPEELGLD